MSQLCYNFATRTTELGEGGGSEKPPRRLVIRGDAPARWSVRLLVLSDVHWAGPAEQARAGHESRVVGNPVLRLVARLWRRWVWLAVPHGHNHRLAAIIERAGTADWVLANGDFTLDTGFVGVSDDAAFESSRECLRRLREAYADRLLTTIGDHDLGKMSLFGGAGGVRQRSLERCEQELGLKRFWVREGGEGVVFIGIASTLAAWPMFAPETPVAEHGWWREEHEKHRAEIAAAFGRVRADQRIVLCCHDPSALAYLHELPQVRQKLPQLAATVIGHLHSPFILGMARKLAGIPRIAWMGATARRYTTALSRARCWREFRVQLCPSPPGLQLLKDGGWLSAELGSDPAMDRFTRHRLSWDELVRAD